MVRMVAFQTWFCVFTESMWLARGTSVYSCLALLSSEYTEHLEFSYYLSLFSYEDGF